MATCDPGFEDNGNDIGARIAAVFVIFAVSAIGSFLPLFASRSSYFTLPKWCFFVTRYFGSGVIVATGFIHLLAEASETLTDECLGGTWAEYPWAEGICMMGVFTMFFFDVLAHRMIEEKVKAKIQEIDSSSVPLANELQDSKSYQVIVSDPSGTSSKSSSSTEPDTEIYSEGVYSQILNSFMLEFGIIFHSVFVGLSLAIAGDGFRSLFAAISFHQLFEGLGLGTRFAMTPWPKDKYYVPWVLSLAYSLTTPIAIAIGIGVRKTYAPGSSRALITTGVFDAACSGVLIYNSLVELMAYDFMHSPDLKGTSDSSGIKKMLVAFFFLSFGAFAMALLGKWA